MRNPENILDFLGFRKLDSEYGEVGGRWKKGTTSAEVKWRNEDPDLLCGSILFCFNMWSRRFEEYWKGFYFLHETTIDHYPDTDKLYSMIVKDMRGGFKRAEEGRVQKMIRKRKEMKR